ncbi:MAG: PilT protein domain protein [Chloroflexi bacterium]|nr:PilT protein domain protein [Chloroflexota bacterium]
MAGLTYDSGALIAADRNDRRLWAIHIRAIERGILPVVPSVILAQTWRGGPQASLQRLLQGCQIESLSDPAARRTGVVLAQSLTADVPDATVVVSAMQRQDAVVTGDRADIEGLARAVGWRPNIIDI